MLTALATSLLMVLQPVPQVRDTISGSVVTSSVKRESFFSDIPGVSTFLMRRIEERGIASPKNLSAVVPGLNIPDYGTSMTSTIYVRGLGSRMDNPVIGLYVDDVPIIDKNCYDFSFTDIRRIDFLHGPQGTLYGRNSMLGVLSVETLSPTAYQGTRGIMNMAVLQPCPRNSRHTRAGSGSPPPTDIPTDSSSMNMTDPTVAFRTHSQPVRDSSAESARPPWITS